MLGGKSTHRLESTETQKPTAAHCSSIQHPAPSTASPFICQPLRKSFVVSVSSPITVSRVGVESDVAKAHDLDPSIALARSRAAGPCVRRRAGGTTARHHCVAAVLLGRLGLLLPIYFGRRTAHPTTNRAASACSRLCDSITASFPALHCLAFALFLIAVFVLFFSVSLFFFIAVFSTLQHSTRRHVYFSPRPRRDVVCHRRQPSFVSCEILHQSKRRDVCLPPQHPTAVFRLFG